MIWPMLRDKGRIIYLGLLPETLCISDITWRKEGAEAVRPPLESSLIAIPGLYNSQERNKNKKNKKPPNQTKPKPL